MLPGVESPGAVEAKKPQIARVGLRNRLLLGRSVDRRMTCRVAGRHQFTTRGVHEFHPLATQVDLGSQVIARRRAGLIGNQGRFASQHMNRLLLPTLGEPTSATRGGRSSRRRTASCWRSRSISVAAAASCSATRWRLTNSMSSSTKSRPTQVSQQFQQRLAQLMQRPGQPAGKLREGCIEVTLPAHRSRRAPLRPVSGRAAPPRRTAGDPRLGQSPGPGGTDRGQHGGDQRRRTECAAIQPLAAGCNFAGLASNKPRPAACTMAVRQCPSSPAAPRPA